MKAAAKKPIVDTGERKAAWLQKPSYLAAYCVAVAAVVMLSTAALHGQLVAIFGAGTGITLVLVLLLRKQRVVLVAGTNSVSVVHGQGGKREVEICYRDILTLEWVGKDGIKMNLSDGSSQVFYDATGPCDWFANLLVEKVNHFRRKSEN